MSSDDEVPREFASAMAPAPEISKWTFPPGPVMDMYYITLRVIRMHLFSRDLTTNGLVDHLKHAKLEPGELAYHVYVVKSIENEFWVQIWGQTTFNTLLGYLKGEGSRIGDVDHEISVKDENEAKCIMIRMPEYNIDPRHFWLYEAAAEAKLREYQRHLTTFGLYPMRPLATCPHLDDGTGVFSQGFDICDRCAVWILGLKNAMFEDLLTSSGRIRWDDETRFCIRHQKGACGFCHPPVGYGKLGKKYP